MKAIIHIILGIAFMFGVTMAHADQSDCKEKAVHCAYFTGLNMDDLNDGRYIKVFTRAPDGAQSGATGCVNARAAFSLGAAEFDWSGGGKYSAKFSICPDGSGNGCHDVGVDNFNYDSATKTATPQYYNIDVSSVVANFKKCKPMTQKNLMLR